MALQNKEKINCVSKPGIAPVEDIAQLKVDGEYIAHLANIVENSDDAIVSKTLNGTIKSWNKGAEKMFGHTPDEAIGKHITLIIPPEYISEEKMILEKIWNNEIIDHYETTRIKKNGERIYVSLTVSPLKDGAGNIVGVSKIARDITEQKRIGEEVIKAYREKETVLNRISESVVSVDNDWRYTFLNDVALATHVLSKQEALGKVIWDVHPEMKGTILWDKYHEAMLTKKEVEFESYYTSMKIWLIIKIYPSDDGLTIFYENVTKTKKAEKELSQTIKEVTDYKFALDEASIVAITDQKGIIKHANQNFCKISKYSLEELIGQDHRIINSGYHSKEFIRNLWITIANGKIWKGELKNKAKDGTIYWVDTTIVPFMNEEGKPYQYVAIRADITERKKGEEEINILHEDLEKRVKERTEDLESFSYSVSHDLRAPLRAVNSYTQMLKANYETQLDTEASRLMNNIMNNAKKMGQLIDNLLTFSRLGRRELAKMHIRVYEMVTAICNELKNEQNNRRIDFDIKQLLPARADNMAIKQVWVNLISNAIKYSKLKEKAIIEIGSEIKEDEIIYYIKDNGAGFDMRYVSKLFNIFQRLHTDEDFEGTGVGLAIVQRIISKHGGRVWAEGRLNEGATFFFTLPKP